MHTFITELIEIGAHLPRDYPGAIVDFPSLIDQMTDKNVGEAVRRKADDRLQRAIAKLSELKFVNLAVDAWMVYRLKTIPCLLVNPYHVSHPVLLELRENENFTKQDYIGLFADLIEKVGSYELVLCSICMDNLSLSGDCQLQILLPSDLSIQRKRGDSSAQVRREGKPMSDFCGRETPLRSSATHENSVRT
jgi:hypothetical protein